MDDFCTGGYQGSSPCFCDDLIELELPSDVPTVIAFGTRTEKHWHLSGFRFSYGFLCRGGGGGGGEGRRVKRGVCII